MVLNNNCLHQGFCLVLVPPTDELVPLLLSLFLRHISVVHCTYTFDVFTSHVISEGLSCLPSQNSYRLSPIFFLSSFDGVLNVTIGHKTGLVVLFLRYQFSQIVLLWLPAFLFPFVICSFNSSSTFFLWLVIKYCVSDLLNDFVSKSKLHPVGFLDITNASILWTHIFKLCCLANNNELFY